MGKRKFKKLFLKSLSSSVLGLIVAMLIMVIGLLVTFIILKYNPEIDIAKFGALGDFYSGIGGTIISGIGIYLVYTSFNAQLKANKIQAKALRKEQQRYWMSRDYDRIIDLIDNMIEAKSKIKFGNNIDIIVKNKKENEAIKEYIDYIDFIYKNPNAQVYSDLKSFTIQLINYLNAIKVVCKYLIKFEKYKNPDEFYILYRKYKKHTTPLDKYLSLIVNHKLNPKNSYDLLNKTEATKAFIMTRKLFAVVNRVLPFNNN